MGAAFSMGKGRGNLEIPNNPHPYILNAPTDVLGERLSLRSKTAALRVERRRAEAGMGKTDHPAGVFGVSRALFAREEPF